MALVQRISQGTLVSLAVAAGVLVAVGLLLALWPRGICDLSPCTINPPGPGRPCLTVRIISPCPATITTLVLPFVAGFVAGALVVIAGIWNRPRRGQRSISSG
jgi:zinc transporter ZupT